MICGNKRRPARVAVAAAVLTAVLSVAAAHAGPDITGAVRVVDGDTLEVGGRRLAQAETDEECACTARHRAFLGRKRENKPPTSEPACLIKGDISSAGERLYHVPGGIAYSRTTINPMKGERWFCSEDEARAAGWRTGSP